MTLGCFLGFGVCGLLWLFGLWHDFVFFEPACAAIESEIEVRTHSSFKDKVEVVQMFENVPYS